MPINKQQKIIDLVKADGDDADLILLDTLDELKTDFETEITKIDTKVSEIENKVAENIGDRFDVIERISKNVLNIAKGEDGKDADEEKIIETVLSKIPKPKDADEEKILKELLTEMLLNMPESPMVDYDYVVTEVIKKFPEQEPVEFPEETPQGIVDKLKTITGAWLEKSAVKGLEILDRIPDIERMAKANALPVTTSFFNGLRAKNLNIVGATAEQSGDTVNVTVASSGGGHTIEDEGTPVTDRDTINFVGSGVSVADSGGKTVVTIGGTGGALAMETPSEAVDGATAIFTFTNNPVAISVDGLLRRVNKGYAISGSGPYTVTVDSLSVPQYDIFSIY